MDNFPTFQTLDSVHRHREAGHPLFSLGTCLATQEARNLLVRHGIGLLALHCQHQHGDWGDLGSDDKAANDQALIDGSRILSVYVVGGERLYLITEAVNEDNGERRSSCLMLVGEY